MMVNLALVDQIIRDAANPRAGVLAARGPRTGAKRRLLPAGLSLPRRRESSLAATGMVCCAPCAVPCA